MCVGKVHNSGNGIIKNRIPLRTNKKSDNMKDVFFNETGRLEYQEDILSLSTYYTKIVLNSLADFYYKFQNTTFYRILTNTTQPAHFVTALAVLVILFLMVPRENKLTHISPLWSLVYLGSFSAHFGAQIWMTFISGLALYFNLPRHTFGSIQKVLFPKYFLLNAGLSLVTLSVYLKVNNKDLHEPAIAIQVGAMTLCFMTELVIRLYLTPPLLRLMTIKNGIEKSAGVGMEVGKLNAGELLKCPHYLNIHKAFRKVHMTIAIGNIICMACTTLHLYYLAHKLCVL